MTSGRDALHRIDAAIAGARSTLSATSNDAANDARALADVDRQEMETLELLAEIRLTHLQEDENNRGGLGLADSRAAALLERHDDHVAEANHDRMEAEKEIERLEAARRDAEEARERAIANHDEAAAATRARLEEDPQYQARAGAVEEANATAERARKKLLLAETDRDEKGAPYEADPLFRYLHECAYGTPDYRAFPLFKMLDEWVARLIRYRQHRLNYERLLELPERLADHAARLEEGAAAAEEALEAFEREALKKDGVDALRDEAGAARENLERIDADLAAAETRHRDVSEAHAKAAQGETGPLGEARTMVVDALSKLSVPDLRVLAAETATLEDDRLVDGLIRLRRERMELEDAKKAAARRLGSRRPYAI